MAQNLSYPANATAVLRSVIAHPLVYTSDSIYVDFQELPLFYDTTEQKVINFENLSQVMNMTDILIDYSSNNTVYVLDASDPYGIYAINLNAPMAYDKKIVNSSDMIYQYEQFLSPRRVLNSNSEHQMGHPYYLMRDGENDFIYYSDRSQNSVGYTRTRFINLDFFATGNAFYGK